MFFRGRDLEQSVWRRFRAGTDGFTFLREDDYYSAHVVANAERVVELFHALLERLPPAVSLAVEDQHTGEQWEGAGVALPDLREAVARLRPLLATYGGLEITVFTPEDQLTLNGRVELFIYATGDQWLYVLQGKGLEEVRRVRTRSWKLRKGEFPPVPELSEAVRAAVERLGLRALASGSGT